MFFQKTNYNRQKLILTSGLNNNTIKQKAPQQVD